MFFSYYFVILFYSFQSQIVKSGGNTLEFYLSTTWILRRLVDSFLANNIHIIFMMAHDV